MNLGVGGGKSPMKVSFKQTLALLLALALILPAAVILSRPLTADAAETSKYQNSMELEPVKLPADTTTAKFVENPKQPAIYTLRSDYRVERDGDYAINYQPYVASVGEAATPEERAKVNKNINLPNFLGYNKPQDNGAPLNDFLITYQKVVDEAKTVTSPSGDDVCGKA